MTLDFQAELEAAKSNVVIYDRTPWGRIEVSDTDHLTFLHNQSTNDLKSRQSGEGCDTVFVTSTARTIDIATTYILDDSVLLLVSPNMNEKLIKLLDRYIFFADKIKLCDRTSDTFTISLIGPQSDRIIEQLGGSDLIGQPYGTHRVFGNLRIAVGSGLAINGYTLISDQPIEIDAMKLSDRAWEFLRIEQGRPMPGSELTDDYNALEAGLWQMISFDKGCYIGQETIARLETYKGVKQQLWGVRLNQKVEPGTVLTVEDEKVGVLTSVVEKDEGVIALAYLRTKAGGAGLQVIAGTAQGTVIEIPFVQRERQN
jgi:tRNA-modifying protein YgfZ